MSNLRKLRTGLRKQKLTHSRISAPNALLSSLETAARELLKRGHFSQSRGDHQ